MENNKIAFASSSLQLDVDYLSVLIMNIFRFLFLFAIDDLQKIVYECYHLHFRCS